MGEKTPVEDTVPGGFGVALRESQQPLLAWTDCADFELRDDDGHLIYAGPRYLRCMRVECAGLVTLAMVEQGGCWCGNRRLGVALRLSSDEKSRLKRGYYPLLPWEVEQVNPRPPGTHTVGWGEQEYKKLYG